MIPLPGVNQTTRAGTTTAGAKQSTSSCGGAPAAELRVVVLLRLWLYTLVISVCVCVDTSVYIYIYMDIIHIHIYVRGTFRYYVITFLSWRRRLNSLDSLDSSGSP